MTKQKILGILSLALLIFAFIFSTSTTSGYSLGDSIIRYLGLKAWSQESIQHYNNGFHYTFIVGLGLLIVGYVGAKHYLKKIYPVLVSNLPVIVIVLLFTSSSLVNWGHGMVLSFSKGIDAISYIASASDCVYESRPEQEFIEYRYHITLKNYGNDHVKFSLRVQKPPNNQLTMIDVPDKDALGNRTVKKFYLRPQEQTSFTFTVTEPNQQHLWTNGTLNRPSIIVLTGDKSREFRVH